MNKITLNCDRIEGIIVISNDGIPVRTTFNQSRTSLYVGLIHGFILKAKLTIKEIDPQNELNFLRLRSHKDEILIAPDKDFTMIVVQNPSVNQQSSSSQQPVQPQQVVPQ